MAKLYFRYGSVSSAKTLNLLAVANNYQTTGKRCLVVKPVQDTRTGNRVVSRAGLETDAHLLLEDGADIHESRLRGVSCVLVDEAQFLHPRSVGALRRVADRGIPVICYGLRTDFRTELFPGSAALMALADSIEEIKTECTRCARKAVFNLRLINGEPTTEGAQVMVGWEESYEPVCSQHYHAITRKGYLPE